MTEQLHAGMTRQQVIDLMGSPLLEAPFDANQWDYVYRLDEAYGDVEQRRLTLTFEGNRLAAIEHEGDFSRPPALISRQGLGPGGETDASRGNLFNVVPNEE